MTGSKLILFRDFYKEAQKKNNLRKQSFAKNTAGLRKLSQHIYRRESNWHLIDMHIFSYLRGHTGTWYNQVIQSWIIMKMKWLELYVVGSGFPPSWTYPFPCQPSPPLKTTLSLEVRFTEEQYHRWRRRRRRDFSSNLFHTHTQRRGRKEGNSWGGEEGEEREEVIVHSFPSTYPFSSTTVSILLQPCIVEKKSKRNKEPYYSLFLPPTSCFWDEWRKAFFFISVPVVKNLLH